MSALRSTRADGSILIVVEPDEDGTVNPEVTDEERRTHDWSYSLDPTVETTPEGQFVLQHVLRGTPKEVKA